MAEHRQMAQAGVVGRAARPSGDGANRRPARLLVVDDEPDIVSMLVSYFTMSGMEAVGAHNAADALAHADEPIDLALLDINMPGMDGIELCRRIDRSSLEKVAICSPDDLVRWLRLSYGYAQQEHFIAVYLNQQNEILHHRVLFIGTLNASMVHPREVFKEAMRQSASSIICAHNHPGGSAEPSSADHHVTRQIVESGKIVGIPLMDHIIVSPNAWFSFRQSGFID